jgi:lincosamide nucleotidyltransferase A/C/D/E
MLSAPEAYDLYQCLVAAGLPIWLCGGWGIDALLEEETRPHKDLDAIVRLEDVPAIRAILGEAGYTTFELWSENQWAGEIPTAFILQDAQGRQLDAHAIQFDTRGDGIPAWDEPGNIRFTPPTLAGQGKIAGHPVQCLSAEMQLLLHTGYEIPAKQINDLARLQQKFNLQFPPPTSA